ncbi:MAG: stage III sporulation protein AF [Clostridiales bacterium]|nr:stage III sporulation protein AF [Clostridiales bacterium]
MDILRNWIITIVYVIILLTFMEILIPNNDNKKYINFVMSLIIMITIIRPIIDFIKPDESIDEQISQISDYLEYNTMEKRLTYNNYFETESIIELYRQNLKDHIKKRVEKNADYSVHDIEISIEDNDEENLGIIKGIEIILKETSDNKKNISNEKIQDIKIKVTLNENNDTQQAHSINIDYEGDLIKDDLSYYYGLEKEKINIYILEDK